MSNLQIEDLTRYESVRRWLYGIRYSQSGMSQSTLKVYLYYLGRFCEFMGKNPDEIIEERISHLQSRNPRIMSTHDYKVKEFAQMLMDEGAAPNSVAVAVAAIKSFYNQNYGALTIKMPRTEVVNHRDIPTREEVSIVIHNPSIRLWVKAWIVAQCQSGLSLKELRTINVEQIYPLLDDPPIVMPMYRGKEHVEFEICLLYTSDAADE